MKLAKVGLNHPHEGSINKAIAILKSGGIVAFPTDTVYGLGAIPSSKKAVSKLYKIKGRSDKKPIALLVSSKSQVKKFAASVPAKAERLMKKYWPGPLTLIFRKKASVPDFLTSGLPTIGIRMPKDKTALALIKAAGGVLAVTSANISGTKPAVTARSIGKLKGIDLILDGGKCEIGIPSSVIAVLGGKLKILRKGVIGLDMRDK